MRTTAAKAWATTVAAQDAAQQNKEQQICVLRGATRGSGNVSTTRAAPFHTPCSSPGARFGSRPGSNGADCKDLTAEQYTVRLGGGEGTPLGTMGECRGQAGCRYPSFPFKLTPDHHRSTQGHATLPPTFQPSERLTWRKHLTTKHSKVEEGGEGAHLGTREKCRGQAGCHHPSFPFNLMATTAMGDHVGGEYITSL